MLIDLSVTNADLVNEPYPPVDDVS